MPDPSSVLPAVVTGTAAIAGAIGSQVVAALFGLKSKRLDIIFRAKSDAYQRLMERVGEFLFEPRNYDKYTRYLAAYEAAFIVASERMVEALSGKRGLNISIQRLRTAGDLSAEEAVKATALHDSMKDLAAAMREDLKHAAGGRL